MKKIFALFLTALFVVGLSGCDLFGGTDIPTEICDTGYHLEGTTCVLDDVTTNQLPTITLVGNPTITIQVGTTYTDAGATANDPENGNITSSIVVTNTVNTAVAGTYTVTYNVTDNDGGAATPVVRTVIVQAAGATNPVITLVGAATVTITVGSTYTDAGATATDVEDGNLTTSIIATNTVNTAVAGTYTVTYNVTDSSGATATPVVRTVIVQEPQATAPVITIVGNATVSIPFGSTYTDQGATATDAEEGDLTSLIVATSTVDTSVAGTYTVSYNVTDGTGAAATTVTRTVIVLPSDAQVLANYIVDNWDGSLQFLGLAMASMDFTSAMTLTTELDFEATEDIDEVHYIHAVITDQFVYAETGDALKRTIDLDVDDEFTITLSMIFKEVETGVHVYIEYGPVFDMIEMMDPNITNMLGWVGFDDEWALFEIDDSLQNVIEIAVVKDMLVDLFFSEVGEYFFYELQTELENEIGFDLGQYGVDLGQFIDYLIEEDFASAQAELEGIEVENIILHFDAMYVAWQLGLIFEDYAVDLAVEGFNVANLALLETAHYDELSDTVILDVTPSTATGTQAFFESLDQEDWDAIIEVMVKPNLEIMVYQSMVDDLSDAMYLDSDLEAILNTYEEFLTNSYGWDVPAELLDLQSMGAIDYWNQLTEYQQWDLQGVVWTYGWMTNSLDELNWILENPWVYSDYYDYLDNDLIEMLNAFEYDFSMIGFTASVEIAKINSMGAYSYWAELGDWGREEFYMTVNREWLANSIERLYQLSDKEAELLNFLQTHETVLNGYGYDATQAIIDLQTVGYVDFMTNYLSEADVAVLMDALLYPFLEDLYQAIQDGEVAEFVVSTVFNDPHVLDLLANAPMGLPVDTSILAANMLAIDFDALVLENVDLEALLTAIYEGQTSFDAFVLALETSAPNSALILEVLSPAVSELQPYMAYVDDVQYAMDGLSVFEHYFTTDYWLNDSNMDMDLDVTDEFYVETIMTLDPIMYQSVLQDLLDDLNTYLLGFNMLPFPYDENWECVDPLDENCEDMDISMIMAMLTQFGDLNVSVLIDPSDATWMEIQFDLTDFLDVLVAQGNAWILDDPEYVADPYNDIMTGINNATITITMSEGGTIEYPTEVSNVNVIAEDVAKFAMVMEVRDYLRELVWHYEMYPSELLGLATDDYYFSDFYFLDISQVFDPELSTIGVDYTFNPLDPYAMPDFSIALYWLDGTEALTGSLNLADLALLFNEDNELVDQNAFDTMVGYVNDANFNTTKLFLMFLLQDDSQGKYDNNYDGPY